MKFYILITVCSAFSGMTLAKEIQHFSPISPTLKFVAIADGKAFFSETTITKSWTDAGAYCKSLGLELASIATKAQTDALNAVWDTPNFNGAYWTSGRDAHLIRQFSWNSTGEAVSTQAPEFFVRPDVSYLTCVYYYARTLRFYPCSQPWNILCETNSI